MDVILFNPAPRSGKLAHRRIEIPLSLLYPASPLDRQGYRVKIIEGFGNPKWHSELREALREKPICFGVTSMTGPQIRYALEGCRLVRELQPEVPIVWGGVHSSLLPEQTLQHPLVDLVVVGEGEETFPELVGALAAGSPLREVKGIGYKENGKVHLNESRPFIDLDKQPPLSYHLVNLDHYRRRMFGRDHLSFNSSRGCPHGCKFCWDPVIYQRKWRALQPETVMEHVRRLVRDYGIQGLLFTDDNFFTDPKRAYRILELMVQANLDLSIGKLEIRADTLNRLDRDFFELMVRANVKRLIIGVESGSQRMLDFINKGIKVEEVIEANRKVAPYPLVTKYLFMMGLPTETREELGESLRLAERLIEDNPHAFKTFNIYTPFPGTELYRMAKEYGLREPQDLEEWTQFNFRNIPQHSGWISPEIRKLIEGLDLPLMFIGDSFRHPYRKTNPLVTFLAKLYYPVARYRVRHMEVRFPLETKLIKALGLFGKQD